MVVPQFLPRMFKDEFLLMVVEKYLMREITVSLPRRQPPTETWPDRPTEPPIGRDLPFRRERKETERDVAVLLGGGEQQIERTLLAVVDDSYPQRRSRGVEHTHRSHQMSPFTAARREREREKGRKRKNVKEAKDTSPPAISTATPGKEKMTLPVLN
ncbi:hypothetical protein F2Q69_00050765 [Brassica cretica]|uniref:Uncharacterized protein n=1 Tax=Brassica cretica TaxID=69181 RepID=A0A8S9PVA3_BRACR|nr:hypothetical protein F2Q69_00050765 [Brassica cretica]